MDEGTAALRIAEFLLRTIEDQGSASMAVSAGPLLSGVLAFLASQRVPWDRVRFVMTDEIQAAPADPRTHYRQVYDAFFSRIGFRPGRALRFWSEGESPDEVAAYYGAMATEVFELEPGTPPRLDAVLLELAPDGTVGSFTPDSTALDENAAFAVPVRFGGGTRYTLTGGTVRRARVVFVVGTGAVAEAPVVGRLRPNDGDLVVLPLAETRLPGAASHP